nr:hypothetical protein BACY1_25630 [Tenacibaculum mesophilum]
MALKYKDKKLINIYPLSDKNKYFISISYNYQKPNSETILLYIVNLIATKDNDKFTFSIPLDYLTRYWKTQTFGNITYHFRNFINTDRAKIFNKKTLKLQIN